MTIAELATQLTTTGYPVVYLDWHEQDAPALPFIAYEVTGTDNFKADNKVYKKIYKVDVTLFTVNKDLTAEAAVETALEGFTWSQECVFNTNEKVYEITYSIEI